jgi:uncharacterized repeat protein (TIGR01451 family)
VSDPLTGMNETIASLSPNANAVFTTQYTITQSDLDAGSVLNVATATDGTITVPGEETVSTDPQPGMSVTKVADVSTYDAVGDVITYTITVTNTGNVTLTNIVVSDPLTGMNETIASLSPNANAVFTTQYTITQSDLDAGSVLNVATATDGTITVPGEETVSTDPQPGMSVTKVADVSTYDAVGDVITYTITVTNTGNVTLTNIVVSDPLTGMNETIASLSPNTNAVFTTQYTITQSDLDAGSVLNVATATDGTITVPGEETVSTDPQPGMSVTKVADVSTYDAVGDVITYTITVTNTGNVTLTNIVVSDPLTGMNETIASLSPNTNAVFTTQYTITQSDLDAGSVLNVATATDGTITVPGEETVSTDPQPGMSVTKVADVSTYDAVGDVITYTITVTNTGNVTLTNIVVSDPLTGMNETIASLSPNANAVFTTQYTITQSDLDAGSVLNVATATDGTITVPGEETVSTDPQPGMSVTKVADVSTYDAVGDVITYTITVTNTGNVTLTNIVVSDPLTGMNETIASLSPNTNAVFTTQYTITQSDLDAGSVLNVATATDGTITVPGEETVSTDPQPGMSVTKVADVSTYDAVGDVITYTITVTNTGNVTLTNIVVSDPLTGMNETIASLSPNTNAVFTTQYTITQSDLDAGSVLNVATATDGTITVPGEETVSTDPQPGMSVTKVADVSTYDAVGDVITYTITVTNTGNVTLTNIVVSDPLTGMNETIASLSPNTNAVFTTQYTITQSDLDAGSVLNVATATDGTITVPGEETVSTDPQPGMY